MENKGLGLLLLHHRLMTQHGGKSKNERIQGTVCLTDPISKNHTEYTTNTSDIPFHIHSTCLYHFVSLRLQMILTLKIEVSPKHSKVIIHSLLDKKILSLGQNLQFLPAQVNSKF